MTWIPNILASADPVEHILDLPWRIGGRQVPWMSAQIGVMILSAALLAIAIPLLTRRNLPRSRRRSMGLVELVAVFIRDHIARPAMGANGDRAMPYLATLFLFLLTCNLLSLVPLAEVSAAAGLTGWGGTDAAGRPMYATPIGGTPASGLWVCAAFALMTLAMVLISGYLVQVGRLWHRTGAPGGDGGDGGHHAPPAKANIWLAAANRLQRRTWPLPVAAAAGLWTWLNGFVPPVPGVVGLLMWPILLALELIGYVTKCFALCIRLVANMTAGHILLGVLLAFAQSSRGWSMALVGLPAGVGVLTMMILELLIAVIQAYIFTFLSALFVGLATNPQHGVAAGPAPRAAGTNEVAHPNVAGETE